MPDLILMQFTPEQAIEMAALSKRYAFLKLLEESGAFDIRNGSLTVHFDHLGAVGSIDKHVHIRVDRQNAKV